MEPHKQPVIRYIDINTIDPNPHQPRKRFDPEEISSLANTIAAEGLLNPPLVRSSPFEKGRYELVHGERRVRACRLLGWMSIPVTVRHLTDLEAIKISLIENLSREDLNCVEIAEGLRDLAEHMSHEEAAKAIGKDNRMYVTKKLRLLKLPEELKDDLRAGRLTEGHAQALLSPRLNDQQRIEISEIIKQKRMAVREAERYIRDLKQNEVEKVPRGTINDEKPAPTHVVKQGEAESKPSESKTRRLKTDKPLEEREEATDTSDLAEHGRCVETLGPGDDLDREIIESLEEFRSLIKWQTCIHIADGFCQLWHYEKGCDPLQKIMKKISGFYFDKELALSVYVREDKTHEDKVLLRPWSLICRRCSAYSPSPDLLPNATRSNINLFTSPPPSHDVQVAVNDESYTRDDEASMEE